MLETFTDEDKVLARYLFDELDETEVAELQDEMLLDDELYERMQVVEMNLIDGYVRHEMTPEESFRFEENFLAVPENKDKVVRAQMFHESLRLLHKEEAAAPAPALQIPAPAREPRWRHAYATLFQKPSPAMAFAALALLAVATLVAYLILRPHGASNHDVVTFSTPTPENINSAPHTEPNNSLAINTTPSQQTPPIVPSTNRNSNSHGLEVAINAPKNDVQRICLNCPDRYSAERGGGEVAITLDKKAGYLALKYKLGDSVHGRDKFTVRIEDQDGEPIRFGGRETQEVTLTNRHGENFIVVKVPTADLKNGGRYTLRVEDLNSPPPVFTIKK